MNYVELISSTFRNIRHGVAPTSPGTCMLFVVGHWIFFNGCADAPKKPKTHPTHQPKSQRHPSQNLITLNQPKPSQVDPSSGFSIRRGIEEKKKRGEMRSQ